MSTGSIAPVDGPPRSTRPSAMDLWAASLAPPPPAGGDFSSKISALMSQLASLLPQVLGMMAKAAAHQGGHGDSPPASPHHPAMKQAQHAPPAPAVPAPQVPPPATQAPPVGAAGGPSKLPSGADQASAGAPPPAPVVLGDAVPPPGGATVIGTNAGGVAQANAVTGVSASAKPDQIRDTGGVEDKVYNVTNSTGRDQSFTYSTNGVNKGTITLKSGETGAFKSDSREMGVRITPTNADGSVPDGPAHRVLYEDGGAGAGQNAGAGNADISKVDGNLDATGHPLNMTVTLSDGRTAGDGDAIHAYQYPEDDAASMGLAGDTSNTANIVVSDI